MPSSPEAVARYRRQLAIHRSRTSALLVAVWDRLGSWDRKDIVRYEATTAAPIAGIKSATVAVSAGFLSLYLDQPALGVNPDDVDVTLHTAGPFHATWHALREGRPFDEALRAGRSAASATGYDFVQRVSRRTGDLATEGETRWKRVPGPNACDWCRSVARDDYRTAESADFGHERDDCIVIPA